jgi:beta-glucosidase
MSDGLASDLQGFPAAFLWGCGTSPTQVEGQTCNEWRRFVARDGTSPDGGPDHWERFEADFDLLSAMHLNAYRLGLDWGRLQPDGPGPLAAAPARRYGEMLASLQRRGVEPFLTLFHFCCPEWLAADGGWCHPRAPEHFADFVRRVVSIAAGVRYWITFNEPVVYALMGYVLGEFLPGRRRRVDLCLRALGQMRRAHGLAYAIIRESLPQAQAGFTKHFKAFSPLRPWHPVDRVMAWSATSVFDRWGTRQFLAHQGRPACDFVGVNYYGRMRMKGLQGVSPLTGFSAEALAAHGALCDDMWEQDPRYLEACLADIAARTGLPLFVTENGVATSDEALRSHYLLAHLQSCQAALRRGVDLRGYFYWSLLDNFEWSEGLSKRFGLAGVDFDHPDRPRRLRPAGRLLGAAARANGLGGLAAPLPGGGPVSSPANG